MKQADSRAGLPVQVECPLYTPAASRRLDQGGESIGSHGGRCLAVEGLLLEGQQIRQIPAGRGKFAASLPYSAEKRASLYPTSHEHVVVSISPPGPAGYKAAAKASMEQ